MPKLRFLWENLQIKKLAGVILIVLGVIILLTPLTPGSFIIFIGLEFLGLRNLLYDKWKDFWKNKNQ